MAQDIEADATLSGDCVVFDSALSLAFSDLFACSECDEPTAILVVGHNETQTGVIPFCASCYKDSPFSEEPVRRMFPTH
jgi:hypothetical protein